MFCIFEYENLEEIQNKLESANGIVFIHKIKEAPWGQQVFRVYEFDGHILEIGEEMHACLRRMKNNGMTMEEIAAKTSYSLSTVIDMLNVNNTNK